MIYICPQCCIFQCHKNAWSVIGFNPLISKGAFSIFGQAFYFWQWARSTLAPRKDTNTLVDTTTFSSLLYYGHFPD